MIEVLMYLFRNYMKTDTTIGVQEGQLAQELQQVGYNESTIDHALHWLAGLNQPLVNFSHVNATRAYHPVERRCLGDEGVAILATLEHNNVLTPALRELVIDRALAMGNDHVSARVLKWIALMVLFGHSKDRYALIWMQDYVFNQNSVMH